MSDVNGKLIRRESNLFQSCGKRLESLKLSGSQYSEFGVTAKMQANFGRNVV